MKHAMIEPAQLYQNAQNKAKTQIPSGWKQITDGVIILGDCYWFHPHTFTPAKLKEDIGKEVKGYFCIIRPER